MKIEIKKGDHVFIPGVVDREPEGEYLYVSYKCGINRNGLEYFRRDDAAKLLIFHPTNGTKNTEPAPKYDPCRKFRKGDKVRVVEWNGRKDCRNGMVATVLSNEQGCFVDIECMIKEVKAELTYPACQLELVTPVEEIEPYKVWDTTFSFNVGAEDSKAVFYYGADMSTCPYTKEQAAAAAEAECERLNAEQTRKEQS